MRPPRDVSVPQIDGRETFDALVRKLSVYFVQQIDSPHLFEDLRKVVYKAQLKPLVKYLVDETRHPALVAALLALKWHFANCEADDDRGISATRGLACELTAWRFVTHLTESEAIEVLCYEVVKPLKHGQEATLLNGHPHDHDGTVEESGATEDTPLLDGGEVDVDQSFLDDHPQASNPDDTMSFATTFAGLNALEIAAVADAKKFLSQKAIQGVVDGIWKGDIVFWDTLGQHSTKQAKVYNKRKSDPFCRLRVPLYLKMFEVLFFAAFLAFYYTVLVEKSTHHVTGPEVMLYIWLASFAYNELVEFWDAGSALYIIDFWSLWDIGIIATGVAFFIVRMTGLKQDNAKLTDTAFDILSVEALFLVPRICSLLSLHPYFGTLLPCLKEMTKDFIKFLGLVAILYVGFDTTFAFLARGTFSVAKMNWILIKVFFGSSYLGFDVAEQISPVLGPPLMFVFVCMTNILLITSLISLMSNTLDKVIEHAREEYLSVYAVYVLEASTSNRLTYFIPPLNLVPLLLRPLRLVMPAEKLRSLRIVLLKATHWPFVALILAWERGRLYLTGHRDRSSFTTPHRGPNTSNPLRRPLSGKSLPKPLLAPGTHLPPLVKQARVDRGDVNVTMNRPMAAPETIEALEMAVRDMRAQIEAFSSILQREKAKSLA